ncbi:MAG: TonB-dependent receptor plug domain-containing protein [Sphingomicrobium sp.]
MVRRTWLLAVGTSAVAFAAPALGQEPVGQQQPAATQDTRTTVYDRDFFAQYAPRTALDIAQRVPGFQLDLGAAQNGVDVRGFAGAAGNVVINGARPSSKAESLETTLARIPAQRVTKVEVGPGDLFGSDYAGKSQVLNIFLSAAGGIDANVSGTARHLYDGKVMFDGSASALIRRGASSINLSAGFGNFLNHEEGTDTVNCAASLIGEPDCLGVADDGQLLEFRRKFNSYHDFNPYLSASWALERAADKAIRLNARWSPGQFDLFQRNRVTPFDGPEHDDNLVQDYDNSVFELGGDVTRPLAGGAIKLVGLATRRKRDNFDAYIQRNGLLDDGAVQNGGFEQTQKAKRNETIGRLSWTRSNLGKFSVEAGAEAALNTLDNHTELLDVNEDGSRTERNLPIADAKVEEKRGEVYLNVGRTLSPALRVDGGIRYEYSDLTVSGDASARRKLKFFKPNLTLDWKPGGGWHSQFSVRRAVAQLDFYDFISFGDLSANRINAGNADLQPQRTWEFRATVDHSLFGDGLFKLDVGHDLVSMLQDRVLICDEVDHPGDPDFCFDAPGNLGTGRRSFASLTLDAPLGMVWKGLRAKLTGTIQRTRVEDPISGDQRKWSGFFPTWQWDLTVRRDAGPFSYGFEVFDNARTTFFRTDEFDTNFNGAPAWNAFIEYRPSSRMSVTLNADHTFGKRRRLLFFPNRAEPQLALDEFRERDRHYTIGITVKQTFGSSGAAK